MPTPDPSWDAPLWAHIASAAPGLPALMATLQAAAAACDAVLPEAPPIPGFDAAAGWANAGGILAGLRLATGIDPPPGPVLHHAPTIPEAAAVVDMLLRDAADHALHTVLQQRDALAAVPVHDHDATRSSGGAPARATLRAAAAAMSSLAAAYTETFARPW